MIRRASIPLMALGLTLLCGCAATARSAAAGPEGKPDCSFHSATTCWTMAGRFPTPRPAAADSLPDDLGRQPPAVLARGADSAAVSR